VRHPWGPCGFIFPWNFPILLIGWGIAPAPGGGKYGGHQAGGRYASFGDLARPAGQGDRHSGRGDQRGCPAMGTLAGAALASHSGLKRVSFTGSPEVGRKVAEVCGRNRRAGQAGTGEAKGAALVFDDVEHRPDGRQTGPGDYVPYRPGRL